MTTGSGELSAAELFARLSALGFPCMLWWGYDSRAEAQGSWARVNAAIDPLWAEELAPGLVKRSVSEPHWSRAEATLLLPIDPLTAPDVVAAAVERPSRPAARRTPGGRRRRCSCSPTC